MSEPVPSSEPPADAGVSPAHLKLPLATPPSPGSGTGGGVVGPAAEPGWMDDAEEGGVPGEIGVESDATEEEREPSRDGAYQEGEGAGSWKAALRRDFEAWLEVLPEEPPSPEDAGAGDTPDLYAFHEQLVAANTESRKANRRVAEAISQWGEVLSRFEARLDPLRESVDRLTAAGPAEGEMPRGQCLLLVEFLDRLHRILGAFASPPPAAGGWWNRHALERWQAAWTAQGTALRILCGHLEAWLKQAGVIRVETVGRAFDPTCMLAVSVETDPSRAASTVVEEILPGYRRGTDLLRVAQVKVARAP